MKLIVPGLGTSVETLHIYLDWDQKYKASIRDQFLDDFPRVLAGFSNLRRGTLKTLAINDQAPEGPHERRHLYRSNNESRMREYGRLVCGAITLDSYTAAPQLGYSMGFHKNNRWFETWAWAAGEGKSLNWVNVANLILPEDE